MIHTDGNTFNNPTLSALVEALTKKGFELVIRYQKSPAPMTPRALVELRPWGKWTQRIKNYVYNRACSPVLTKIISDMEALLLGNNFDIVLAVDRIGLIEAAAHRRLFRTPFVLFSFEIMFESETSKRYKMLEREGAKGISHAFVQDEIRQGCLAKENCIDVGLITCVPLASKGLGQPAHPRLRDQLGIPPSKHVAIMIGSLSKWTMAAELIASVRDWPDDWCLVVHERYGRAWELKKKFSSEFGLLEKRVYWTNDAVESFDDLGKILAGVDAGLAFYRPDFLNPYAGKNLVWIGLSAGKISTYLRFGVPVIMNDIGLFSDYGRKHGFALIADSEYEIGGLLPMISAEHHENAIKFFSNHLDFAKYEKTVINIINSASLEK